MTTDFEALAKRCESSNEPERAIDGDIHVALGLASGTGNDLWMPGKVSIKGNDSWQDAPRYTSSLDTAMPLVEDLRGLCLSKRSNLDMGGKDWLVTSGSFRGAARSWPRAICAVALRRLARG